MTTRKVITANGFSNGNAVVGADRLGNKKVLDRGNPEPGGLDARWDDNFESRDRHAVISAATGNSILVAAIPGKQIVVTGISMTLDATGTTTILSDTTALTGTIALVAGTPFESETELVTAAGEALKITNVTGAAEGFLTYRVR